MKTKSNRMLVYGSILGTLFLFSFWPKEHEDQLITVAKEGLPKTVMIITVIQEKQEMTSYMGAGVFISPNGQVLTCAHLFDSGKVIATAIKTYDGSIYPSELLYKDSRRDLALLGTGAIDYPFVHVENPQNLQVGQEALAIGYPLGLEFSVTHGIISYLNRDFSFAYNAIQTDTFINPGNSGGPLFNLKGNLIGINTFIIHPVLVPGFTGCAFGVHPRQINEFLMKFRGLDRATKS